MEHKAVKLFASLCAFLLNMHLFCRNNIQPMIERLVILNIIDTIKLPQLKH